jgi:hypothetical protein
MTMFLHTAILILASLAMGVFTAHIRNRSFEFMTLQSIAHTTVAPMLSLEEQEEVKRYATIFGLDNDTVASALNLLEMGRKVEANLGSDKVNEIVRLSRQELASATSSMLDEKSNGAQHIINLVMKTWQSFTFHTERMHIFLKRMGGGRNDEEASAIH